MCASLPSPCPLCVLTMANYAKQLLANAKAKSPSSWGWGRLNKHIFPSLHTVLIAWPNDFLIANQFQAISKPT